MPGGKERCGTIGPLSATVFASVTVSFATAGALSLAPLGGAGTGPVRSGAGRPPVSRRAAIAPASPKMATSTQSQSPVRQAPLAASPSGAGHAATIVAGALREPVALGEQGDNGGRQDQDVASIVVPLSHENTDIKGVVQHERAAGQEPGNER
jgi:hypothetical protein